MLDALLDLAFVLADCLFEFVLSHERDVTFLSLIVDELAILVDHTFVDEGFELLALPHKSDLHLSVQHVNLSLSSVKSFVEVTFESHPFLSVLCLFLDVFDTLRRRWLLLFTLTRVLKC